MSWLINFLEHFIINDVYYCCMLQDPKQGSPSHELRTLQRKNVELSSLVKKLDEKNQQLATRNTELVSNLDSNNIMY